MPTRRPVTKKAEAKKSDKKKPPVKAGKPAATSKAPPKPTRAEGKSPKAASKAPPPKAAKSGTAPSGAPLYDAITGLIEAFGTSNRITQFLVTNLHEDTWHAAPPGGGRGRTIAAIVSHIHNARVMWLEAARAAGKSPRPPAKLDRLAATKEDAVKALDLSYAAIAKMIAPALKTDGKVANFKAGAAAFMAYLMTHDAHHRGQICLQAKLVGHPLADDVGYGMWEWSKR